MTFRVVYFSINVNKNAQSEVSYEEDIQPWK